MKLLKIIIYIATCLLLSGVAYVHMTKDTGVGVYRSHNWQKIGKELYVRYKCPSCHGDNGGTPTDSIYPYINGQSAEYLRTQIEDIQSGIRSNGKTSIMKTYLSEMKKEEIHAIAEYLHSVPLR